LKFEIFEILT